MREPTVHFPQLLELLNFTSKRELLRHCRNVIVHQQDLVALIVAAQHGTFEPYRYANHFARTLPEHLFPNEAEQSALSANGVGPFRSREARKFGSKVFQLLREQRALAAHLLYTPNHQYWHLFYFDNRDTSEAANHWRHGAHIHYVSDLWPELSLATVWQRIHGGDPYFASKAHLHYVGR